jgi:hypothetical protein
MKSGNLNFLEPSGPLQAGNGTALAFYSLERATNALWIYECDCIRCFDHSCGHLQGGKGENTNVFIVFQDHSTVKIVTVVSRIPDKWSNIVECKYFKLIFVCILVL